MQNPSLDVEPAEVGVELGKAGPKAVAGKGLRLEMQAVEDPIALLRVRFGQRRGDACFGKVEAAAFDEKRHTRLPLEIEPQLAGFEGQPRVNGIQVVVANRPGYAEGRRTRIAQAPLVQDQDPGPALAREVG